MTDIVDVITNAGAMAALAYLVLLWKREDDKEGRSRLIELIEATTHHQKLTAEALERVRDSLHIINERLTRLEVIRELTQPNTEK